MYGLRGPGDPGDPAGDQDGLYPGLKPESIGEKPAAPGVMAAEGDQALYEGVEP
jgi:hypothetical protein